MADILEAVAAPPATAAEAPARVRFECVEGLRALAALAVFFVHVAEVRYSGSGYIAVGFDRYVRAFSDELVIGVPIFFSISGFVLYRPFVARHVGGAREPSTSSYFARRVLRIYPAYWAALVITVLFFSKEVFMHGTGRWIANLGLVQYYVSGATGHGLVFMGMLQAWTLTAEITFYATLPLFAFFVRRAAGSNAAGAHWVSVSMVMVAGVATRMWAIYGSPRTWVTILPIYLSFFAIGMGLAIVSVTVARGRTAPRVIELWSRHPGWSYGTAALAFLVDTVLIDSSDGRAVSFYAAPTTGVALMRFVLQWIVTAGLLLPSVLRVEDGGRARRVLSSRIAVFLGSISYGFYLWHWAIVRWVADHWFDATSGQTVVKVTAVALPATIAVAYLSLQLVERPAIRLGKKFR